MSGEGSSFCANEMSGKTGMPDAGKMPAAGRFSCDDEMPGDASQADEMSGAGSLSRSNEMS
ncbi:hypothetical protein LAD12857_41880 [Lacrimispora amygdalina]|uniref:Uncharacterized protein n=1 Tax=Lacrimispora amygdalina TaxID=253257 RepID=A0ABQ5MBS8_9FIRM